MLLRDFLDLELLYMRYWHSLLKRFITLVFRIIWQCGLSGISLPCAENDAPVSAVHRPRLETFLIPPLPAHILHQLASTPIFARYIPSISWFHHRIISHNSISAYEIRSNIPCPDLLHIDYTPCATNPDPRILMEVFWLPLSSISKKYVFRLMCIDYIYSFN